MTDKPDTELPERIWIGGPFQTQSGLRYGNYRTSPQEGWAEYVRTNSASTSPGDVISRKEAVWILETAAALADPDGVIPIVAPEHSRLAAVRDSLKSAALAIADLPTVAPPAVGVAECVAKVREMRADLANTDWSTAEATARLGAANEIIAALESLTAGVQEKQ